MIFFVLQLYLSQLIFYKLIKLFTDLKILFLSYNRKTGYSKIFTTRQIPSSLSPSSYLQHSLEAIKQTYELYVSSSPSDWLNQFSRKFLKRHSSLLGLLFTIGKFLFGYLSSFLNVFVCNIFIAKYSSESSRNLKVPKGFNNKAAILSSLNNYFIQFLELN